MVRGKCLDKWKFLKDGEDGNEKMCIGVLLYRKAAKLVMLGCGYMKATVYRKMGGLDSPINKGKC